MIKLSLCSLVLFLVACGQKTIGNRPVPPGEAYSWVMPFGNDSWLLRTLGQTKCPDIEVDGMKVATSLRRRTSEDFPLEICETLFKRNAQIRTDFKVPPMNPDPKKIVVIGDTGCKVKVTEKKMEIQDCNKAEAWPFALVARSAANWNPDLVIHVGDFHYRESDCPKDHPECLGSKTGDNWESWQQDFFEPARPLLEAAPWIFVRGNHELCKRGGHGWFNLLDHKPFVEGCADKTPPYIVSMKEKDFLVLDSADDGNIQPSLNGIKAQRKNTWLLSHRPIFTAKFDDESTLVAKVPKELKDFLSLSLVGHVHTVSLNRFGKKQPAEFILGIGGSKLDQTQTKESFQAVTFHDFGFTTLEKRTEKNWKVIIHDRYGKDIIRCDWTEKGSGGSDLRCQ